MILEHACRWALATWFWLSFCVCNSRALLIHPPYTVTHILLLASIRFFLSLFFLLPIKRWWWNFRILWIWNMNQRVGMEKSSAKNIAKIMTEKRKKGKECFSTFISHILVKRFHCSFSLPQSTVDGYVVRILTSMYLPRIFAISTLFPTQTHTHTHTYTQMKPPLLLGCARFFCLNSVDV